LREPLPRPLTFRYVGALLAIAGLLLAGQLVVQSALDRQEGDARVVNLAGRQRMLGQRLCMLLLAHGPAAELARVADEWQASERALQDRGNSQAIAALFARIGGDHQAMLDAARTGDAATALAHQDAFLSGMDRIVAEYEREARARVVSLRYVELVLFALAIGVLAMEGAFVFRPAVRALGRYVAQRDRAQQELVMVSDREQQRIAHDLHDGLCQELVGISYLVKLLPAGEQREEIIRLLSGAIDQTRGLARGLHSATLEAEGLAAALRELAGQTERLYAVKCNVRAPSGDEPPADVRAQLYRIAREAVVNAAKHAKATAIEVELGRRDHTLVLAVRDDGIGIAGGATTGLGLHMMRSRAKILGATLDVAAGASGGTIVSCSVTVPA
jgi:signal transduction histidine kinase